MESQPLYITIVTQATDTSRKKTIDLTISIKLTDFIMERIGSDSRMSSLRTNNSLRF